MDRLMKVVRCHVCGQVVEIGRGSTAWCSRGHKSQLMLEDDEFVREDEDES
jgi:hypothetical protein